MALKIVTLQLDGEAAFILACNLYGRWLRPDSTEDDTNVFSYNQRRLTELMSQEQRDALDVVISQMLEMSPAEMKEKLKSALDEAMPNG